MLSYILLIVIKQQIGQNHVGGRNERVMRESSRTAVMKVSNIPETNPLNDSGMTIFTIRLIHPMPWILAVSSID